MGEVDRRGDLISASLGDEVVVYDPENHRAHALDGVAVAVWREWGRAASIGELRIAAQNALAMELSDDTVRVAVAQLTAAGLLGESADPSRRDLLKGAVRLGAAAVATPLLVSVLVPHPASAISCGVNGSPCVVPNGTGTCQAGVCFVTACSPGFVDCDGIPTNGCECAGSRCCSGTTPSSSGTCEIAHTNGYGGAYYDCYPDGVPGISTTYNVQMALDACNSYPGPGTCVDEGPACGIGSNAEYMVCKPSTTDCTCWAYKGSGTMETSAGHTFSTEHTTLPFIKHDGTCYCPDPSDRAWT